ncbi:MAG: hypothetical protein ACOWWR_01950 [Eubacteriales bacterium]
MVLTEKRMYNYYFDDDDIAVTRIRNKYHRKDRKKIKGSSKIKCILFIALIFVLATVLMVEHSKINTLNNDIIQMEKDLKEISMRNDTKEGLLLSSLDLDSIEKTAKEELGMVEPSTEQYTYLAISDTQQLADGDTGGEADKTNKTVSWFARLID